MRWFDFWKISQTWTSPKYWTRRTTQSYTNAHIRAHYRWWGNTSISCASIGATTPTVNKPSPTRLTSPSVCNAGSTRRTNKVLHVCIMQLIRGRSRFYSIWMSWERTLTLKLIQGWGCCIWQVRVIRWRLWFITGVGWILTSAMREWAHPSTGQHLAAARPSPNTSSPNPTSTLTYRTLSTKPPST